MQKEIIPPQVVVISNFDEFLEKGQPIEESLTDEQVQDVTPIDLLFSKNYISKEERDTRFDMCKKCDKLWKPTKTCRECGCFMGLKTWIKDAACPLKKW